MGETTGDMCFLLLIMFSIVPAAEGYPVHHLSNRVIDLCKRDRNPMTFHADIALIELLLGLIGKIMTGGVARLEGEDAIRRKMPLHRREQRFLILTSQKGL